MQRDPPYGSTFSVGQPVGWMSLFASTSRWIDAARSTLRRHLQLRPACRVDVARCIHQPVDRWSAIHPTAAC